MSLDKAIKSGKEKRKQYYKSKAFDGSCRNHGGCPWCERNRTYFDRKRRFDADEKVLESKMNEVCEIRVGDYVMGTLKDRVNLFVHEICDGIAYCSDNSGEEYSILVDNLQIQE